MTDSYDPILGYVGDLDFELPDPELLLKVALRNLAAADGDPVDYAYATSLATIAMAIGVVFPVEEPEPAPVDQGRAWATLDHVYRILTSATQDGPRNPAVHAALREIDRLRGP